MKLTKILSLILIGGVPLSLVAQVSNIEKKEAQKVISRTFEQLAKKVVFESIDKQDGKNRFVQQIKNGKLIIQGSSGVALCKGVYDFVTNNNYGTYTWTGGREQIPTSLEHSKTRSVTSPVENHFYFNVVTYGYSMPYWDWARWEKEIDYMALHGIDMPLALVANETISARVWKKLGLTDEQISAYFVGPAHFPWMRMGNVSGIDGPLPQSWHKGQIELQHKILNKMRGLGMKPICPAFAGFVPKAIKDIYPDAEIVETQWGGAFNNWMVMPKSELFSTIGTMFIEEWEKEFGKNVYYLADSFNEMEIPFPEIGTKERYDLLAEYGDILYKSIQKANPNAVWVMQGWMFGYQRHIWEPRSLAALCSRVPDDKMLLLDEAVDYNKHFWGNGYNWDFYKGFFNKPWIYASIPNMGGKTGLTGVLEFYANGHLAALNSPNKGRLSGFGMAPEGIENNEVIYELITDAAWRSDSVDLKEWLHNYSTQRYGECKPEIDSAWQYLTRSVYGTFTDHPRYNWQLRPGVARKGTINSSSDMYRAIELFAQGTPDATNELYKADLAELTAAYLGGKMEILVMAIENAYTMGEVEKAAQMEQRFFELAYATDKVLESHPTQSLKNWIVYARKHGDTKELADYYEKNARRIVTIWGPPIDDYSARIWSGLIRDYYIPRWKAYFDSKRRGVVFDQNEIARWERTWVEQTTGVSDCKPYDNLVESAVSLINSAKDISMDIMPNVVGNWGNASADNELKFAIAAAQLRKIKGLKFNRRKGDGTFTIESIAIEMDGVIYNQKLEKDLTISASSPSQQTLVSVPESATGNNSCVLIVKANGRNIAGNIEMVF